jgi:hypothetical protein
MSLVSFCSASPAFTYTPPETIGVKTWQSYILIHGVKSKAGDRTHLEHWLKNIELNRMFWDPAIDPATLYRPDPPTGQPDYYLMVRFDVLNDPGDAKNYKRVSKRIEARLDKILERAPRSLETTHKLFYREHHRGRRMEPRYSGNFSWQDKEGKSHTVSWGDSFGANGRVKPGPVKYADYGFSHSCDDARQWEYIRWYQEVRQHDVIGPQGAYDNYRMWLLVPGQHYEYVLTMYEFSPVDIDQAQAAWSGSADAFYLYLTDKDIRDPNSLAFEYCTGPRGHTTVIKELYKDRSEEDRHP